MTHMHNWLSLWPLICCLKGDKRIKQQTWSGKTNAEVICEDNVRLRSSFFSFKTRTLLLRETVNKWSKTRNLKMSDRSLQSIGTTIRVFCCLCFCFQTMLIAMSQSESPENDFFFLVSFHFKMRLRWRHRLGRGPYKSLFIFPMPPLILWLTCGLWTMNGGKKKNKVTNMYLNCMRGA